MQGSQSTHTLNLDFKTYTLRARFSPDHPSESTTCLPWESTTASTWHRLFVNACKPLWMSTTIAWWRYIDLSCANRTAGYTTSATITLCYSVGTTRCFSHNVRNSWVLFFSKKKFLSPPLSLPFGCSKFLNFRLLDVTSFLVKNCQRKKMSPSPIAFIAIYRGIQR